MRRSLPILPSKNLNRYVNLNTVETIQVHV
jgi:hypothetical protein